MRVVAATFSKPSQASAACELLSRGLHSHDVQVAPLGHPGEKENGDAVLAGRFPDDVAAAVVALVERAGGVIVANIDERWTGSSSESADRVRDSREALEFKVAGWSSGSSSGS